MFTKVPPRTFKGFLFITLITMVLLVSCTTAVDSLAMSHLAAQQSTAGVRAGGSHQLPGGNHQPPPPPDIDNPDLNSRIQDALNQGAGPDDLLKGKPPEGLFWEELPVLDNPAAARVLDTPAGTVSQNQGEKPEVSPDTRTAPRPEPDSTPKPDSEPKAEPAPQPDPEPEPEPEPEPKPSPEPDPEPEPDPVRYVWGSSKTIHFRTEVEATNTGSETATRVSIGLPLLENNSPYQKTTRTGTNYPIESQSGRTATFNIGELEPGETKTVVVDYKITIRPVSISSTNETVEKARIAYDKYAGSGNCHTLAVGFVNHAKSMGLDARVVTGYKRRGSGDITPGSLSGARHSWAEFRVDGLGWVPVDLTHMYFARIPHASHVVETYSANHFLRIGYSGGNITTEWRNMIM